MKIIKTNNKKIIATILFFICSLFFISGIWSQNTRAFAAITGQYNYTDSDYLTEGEAFTIRDYSNRLIGTQAHVQYEDGIYRIVSPENDDPIVSIIPKNLFYTVGSELVIGKEYGYYINTSTVETNYVSTVMVFDITVDSNLELTTDRIFVTIKPLFEYKYVCVLGMDMSIFMGGYSVIYSASSYCVVPYANISGASITYLESTQYYLKDISCAGQLYNEQHLNVGDALYESVNDYGSYFTAFDYEYSGKYRKNFSFPIEDTATIMSDAVQIGISFVEKKNPAIGIGIKALGKILEVASTTGDAVAFYDSISNWLNGEVVQTEKKITTSCFYQNRNDQLTHYKDSNGEPALAKFAGLTCNTSENESVWYSSGDYIRAIFYVGHGGGNGITPYLTRFIGDIALKVVDSSTNEVVKTERGLTSTSLRNPEYKTISFDGESSVYMLAEGQDNFTFNAIYESDYDIIVNLSSEADIYINGTKYQGKDISVRQHVLKNGGISIALSQNAVGLAGIIKIAPNSSTTIDLISSGQDYILKTTLIGVRKLKTSNSDLEIKEFFILEDGNLSKYSEYGDINPCDEVTYPFKSNTYYVVIYNKSLENLITQKFLNDDIDSLNIGVENIVNLGSSNLNYFKIAASTSVNHVISLPNAKGVTYEYKILNPDLSIGDGRSYINAMYIAGLEENKTFYFGVKTGIVEEQTSILINKTDNAFQWKITGGEFGIDGEILSQNKVAVKRGKTYSLSFLINGNDSKAALFSVDSSTSWGYYGFSINSDTNQIVVPLSCPIGGDGITIKAWDSVDNDTSYNHTLKVIPTGAPGLNSVEISNSDDITVTIYTPRFVSKIAYQLSFENLSKTGTITIDVASANNTSNTKTVSLLSKIQGIKYDTPEDIKFQITKVYYYDAYKNEKSDSMYQHITLINNLFETGNGTSSSPYIINCGRHIDNIRKSVSSEFEVKNDITCPNSWIPIPSFDGVLNMKTHSITLQNTSIATEGNYGFIDLNYGYIYSGSFYPHLITNSGGTTTVYNLGVVCAVNYGTIERCYIRHTSSQSLDIYVKAWHFYFGGIAGSNYGKLDRCVNNAIIRGNCVNFGGIVGWNGGENNNVYSCSNHGNIYGEADGTMSACFGGIFGIAGEGSIVEQPYNDANLLFDYKNSNYNVTVYIGQIAGRMCKADELKDAYCAGSAKIKQGVYVYQYYLTDNAVGMYFESSKPSEGGSCIAAGTLITLADGRQVPVETLTGNEMLLVWNLHTGSFDIAPILFIDHDAAAMYKIINLQFSDGTKVKVIDEHAFWDFNLNRYVFLREDAGQYVGHWFNKQATDSNGNMIWTRVQLTNVTITDEYTTALSPVTYGHLCIYVNGMLSMPGATEGLINIFEVDGNTMQINQEQYLADIATYGLFTYDEFAEIYPISETIFEAFGGEYLKVSIGKGLIDYETLGELIERYSKFFRN